MKKEANISMLSDVLFAALLMASAAFIWQGVLMHSELNVDRVTYEELQRSFYSVAKEVRDVAPADSPLNEQYAKVLSYPVSIEMRSQAANGKILTGIYFMILAVAITVMMLCNHLLRGGVKLVKK